MIFKGPLLFLRIQIIRTYTCINGSIEPLHEKTCFFAYAKTKAQISCTETTQLTDQCLYFCYVDFLNRKFQASI